MDYEVGKYLEELHEMIIDVEARLEKVEIKLGLAKPKEVKAKPEEEKKA